MSADFRACANLAAGDDVPQRRGPRQLAEPLEDVEVDMTLTSPGCPSHVTIGDSVRRTIEALPGVQSVSVNFIWTPQWGPERISPEGRQILGIEV